MIHPDNIDAIKVQFIKSIFEDDFVEKGMTAWLTDVVWDNRNRCYNLYFDFTEFEDINRKYFKRVYHPNRHTQRLIDNGLADESRKLFTAEEAGQYEAKYSVYFSCVADSALRNDTALSEDIKEYLRVVAE